MAAGLAYLGMDHFLTRTDTAAHSTVGVNLPNSTTHRSPLSAPLDRASERVTKKPFGIFITPARSPVQPERFSGYHTGTDYEVFPNENDSDVVVRAICGGVVIEKRRAGGYGGVIVTSGILGNQPVTVVYGHLKLASVSLQKGDSVQSGGRIGVLGEAYSGETDGERKHLHVSIHRGTTVNIRGYVNSKSDLEGWIDPDEIRGGVESMK